MSGYILEGTIEQPIANDVFYQLSKIAYGENLRVKSTAVSKGTSVKKIRIDAKGETVAVEAALNATKRCIAQLPKMKIEITPLLSE